MNPTSHLLALGANLTSIRGNPQQTLAAAVRNLAERGITLRAVSRFFETPCFPSGAGPDYVNAALVVNAQLTPNAVLQAVHEVEAQFERTREVRWGQRTLDIDLLASGGAILPDAQHFADWRDLPPEAQRQSTPDQLILPHPRLQDRAFVLVPLNDVAPGWRHPVSGLTVAQMLAALPEAARAEVRPI